MMLLNKVRENLDFNQSKGKNFNFPFKNNIFQIKPLLKNKIFPKIVFGDLIIKLVDSKSELKKAQGLRYSVFYKEKKAKLTFSKKMMRLDYDKTDKFADHLIVIDNKKGNKNKIVGTYRLIRGDVALHFEGFYTSSEFDLTNILNSYKQEQILELGRSCVHKDYRNGTIMNLLWKAIAEYVKLYDIKVLLGCASFPGTDIQEFSKELSYLKSNFSLPKKISVKSLANNYNYPVYNENNNNESDLRTFAKLPPLIKGYLRVGGKVSDSFFVDYDFNTTDICVVVETDNINEKYKNKFLN